MTVGLQKKQEWQKTWSTIISILSEYHQDPSVTETFFEHAITKKTKKQKKYVPLSIGLIIVAHMLNGLRYVSVQRTIQLSICKISYVGWSSIMDGFGQVLYYGLTWYTTCQCVIELHIGYA